MHIKSAAPSANARPQWKAFLSLGFRPLYMAGCAWALLSIAIWIFAPQLIGRPLSGIAWHAHEMLWGFIATIAVAFLLTASANWTGLNPLKGWPLGLACLLWLVARIGYLAAGTIGFQIACLSELAFFMLSGLALLRVVLKAKSRRNYGIPLMVLGLGASDALYLKTALTAPAGNPLLLMQRFDLGLLCMAVIALLIARRVIPFFAMRAVSGLEIPMHTRSGQIQVALAVAAIACGLGGLAWPMALALGLVGVISLFQVVTWQPLAVRHNPLLWILYLGYSVMGAGLLLAALYTAGLGSGILALAATHVHLIAMGGFSILIIGMVTRTALGHLGRPLKLDRSMRASYGLVIAAAALRLAALWPASASMWLLQAAALCWIAAFGLYLWRFTPMLIRPRPSTPPAVSNGGQATVTLRPHTS